MIKRVFAILLLIPATCWALSLGTLDVQSHLNQPLQAKIAISDFGNISPDQLQISLASQIEFARAKMAKTDVVQSLHFKMVQSPNLPTYILVTSSERINEPFISFLLQASWPKGDYIKKYIILLDPVVATPPAKVVVAEHTTNVTVQRDIPKVIDHIYGPTEKNQRLWAIAKQVRPSKSVTVDQTMLALVQYNPNAFLLHNVNGLMDGYYLRIPSTEQISATSKAAALKQIQRHHRYWKLKKKVNIILKAEAAPTGQPSPQQQAVASAEAVAQIAASPGLEMPAAHVSVTEKTPQQSINEDEIISLRAELDAALKDNELLKQKNQSIQEQISQLQQQNKQLHSDVTSAQQSTVRLQQLMNSQTKLVVQNKQSSVGIGTWLRKNWGLVLGALAIVVLLVVFILRRRQASYHDDGEPTEIAIKKRVTVDVPNNLNDESLDVEIESERETSDININYAEQKKSPEENINVSDILPDVTVKEIHRGRPELAVGEQTDINALLEEAKLYVDYGRHKQAIQMLQKAIDSEPRDPVQWEGLLRVITDCGDKKLFGKAVAKIPVELLNTDEQALWKTVETLRLNFKQAEPTTTKEEPAEPNEPGESQQDDDFDSDSEAITLSPLSAEECVELNAANEAEEGDAKDQIDFDLGTEPAIKNDVIDLKLTDDEDFEITIEQDSSQQQDPHDVIASEDTDMSKLDLIRAYIEMGDHDSAKKLLNELLKYGNAETKLQAEHLLAKLEK